MTALSDVFAAMRHWRRRPGTPVVAVAFLACGMGAAASVFAVADASLWRPLPLPEPARVLWVQSVDRGQPGDSSPGLVQAWRERARSVDALGALRPTQGTWRDRSGTDRLDGAQVTATALGALGLSTIRGRLLTADDEKAGAAPVVVITHRLWQARFGGRADTIGLEIEIDGRAHTVVGALAAAVDALPFGGDWFVPLALPASPSGNGPRYLDVVARLSAGQTARDAERELAAIAASVGAVGDEGSPLSVRVQPLMDAFSDGAARVLEPLLAAALVVLVIAAVNAANLRLADHLRRRGEMAVRAALGASRGRLVSQLLAEALLVSVAAGGLGLLLAHWGLSGLQVLLPPEVVRTADAHIDARAILFMLAVVIGVTVISGVLPAMRYTRGPLTSGALSPSRAVIGGDERLRRVFVVAQIGLAMTLGAAGALMVQTTRHLAEDARGYRTDRVWTAAVRLSRADFPATTDITGVTGRIIDRVAALPGAERVAIASRVPLAGGAPGSDVALVGEPFTPGIDRQARIRFVTPGYFDATDVPVREGRDVAATDAAGREPVVLVNETLAARLTPGRSPVGEFVTFAVRDFNVTGTAPTAWRIVGLVADTRDRGPRLPAEPEVYISLAQGPSGVFDWIGRQLLLVVRTAPGVALPPATLRTAVNAADPRVPAFDVQTFADRFEAHVSTERVLAGLLVPLAGTGLLLAGFGIFAVVMHAVYQRRREIAVRMVLGASPADIMRETGRSGLRMAASGVVLGSLGAAGAGRLLASVAYGVSPLNPLGLVAVTIAVALTTLAAVWIPARRAAGQDPALALRAE